MSGESIRFSAFYRDAIRRELEQRKRLYMPWHTETDPHDPINAALDLAADMLAGVNCRIDLGASERFWTSVQQRRSALDLARMMGYTLSAAIPARVGLLARLASLPPSFPATIVAQLSQWGTEGDDLTPGVMFEADEDLIAAGSGLEVYLDGAADVLYVGHRTLCFDSFDFSAAAYPAGATWAVEYWDADYGYAPGDWLSFTTDNPITDGTSGLAGAGTVSWDVATLFHDASTFWRRWGKTTVNGVEAYWVRFRKLTGSVPTTPVASVPTSGTWYAWFEATQGTSVTDSLGSTTSAALQKFYLNKTPYINGSLYQFAVGTDTTWTRVDSFFEAGPADKAYLVREDSDGWHVQFGDGVNGAIPPEGVTVEAAYRIGADSSGNAGPGAVTINRSGTSRIAEVTNPAAATGWAAPEGATTTAYSTEAAALARTREMAPAIARANQRAITLEDHEVLACRWLADDGRRPVTRAYGIADGAGPRSVSLLVCGPSGAAVSATDLAALQENFVGVRRGTQRIGGVSMLNADCVVSGFTSKVINVTGTMYVLRAYASGAKASAEAAIAAMLSPVATWEDGTTYRWWPDNTYTPDILQAAAIAAVPGVVRWGSFSPASLVLGPRELPVAGTVTITVVEV